MNGDFSSPAITVSIALAAGIIAQVIAQHVRVPGIVVLLVAGVLLGPDVANLVQPALLGEALMTLVGFAVAVILFEGGMNLQVQRLRREERAIRQLVTLGALTTMVGAALCAKAVLGWDLRTSLLFGTLVIVTGPTVITPLLRRFKVEHQSATVLEAEGVLIDAVGAVVATVALEVALSPTGERVVLGVVHVPMSLATGAALGAAGGYLLAKVLAMRELIPDGLENVFTLASLLALFQTSNAIMAESGIAAATVAGIVVGNISSRAQRELHAFKEQLTALFIGMLFVLLAADVRLSEVHALGMPGIITVALLVFFVRPLNVAVGTFGTELSTKQKVFIAAIGPRGIIAAAVAAFFSSEMGHSGLPGGTELRALVFLVIVVTVGTAALGGGMLASLLGLRRASDNGWVVLSAHALARLFARTAMEHGDEVLCIDTNPAACDEAQREGIRVIYGNALKESVLSRAAVDTRSGAVALSTNTEVNLLFMSRVRAEGQKTVHVSVGRTREGTALKMLREAGAHVLFGRPSHIELWDVRLRQGTAMRLRLRYEPQGDVDGNALVKESPNSTLLPFGHVHGKRFSPFHDGTVLREGDEVFVLVDSSRIDEARTWLLEHGFRPEEAPTDGDADGRTDTHADDHTDNGAANDANSARRTGRT